MTPGNTKTIIGWGHGCAGRIRVTLALKAGVKKLVLFHHDPDHNDRKVDAFVAHARRLVCEAEGKIKGGGGTRRA